MTSFKIPTEEPKWSPDQAAALRQFLNGANGQAFLQRLFWLRPKLVAPSAQIPYDVNARLGTAERQAGYEEAIDDALLLTVSPETPTQ